MSRFFYFDLHLKTFSWIAITAFILLLSLPQHYTGAINITNHKVKSVLLKMATVITIMSIYNESFYESKFSIQTQSLALHGDLFRYIEFFSLRFF